MSYSLIGTLELNPAWNWIEGNAGNPVLMQQDKEVEVALTV